MSDSNIASPGENRYYQVLGEFRAYIPVAHVETNTHIGQSRALSYVWQPITVAPGEMIASLVGGEFLSRGNEFTQTIVNLPTQPLLVKGPRLPQQWPTHLLEETGTSTSSGRTDLDLPTWTMSQAREAGATLCEDGSSWVLPG